MFKKYSANILNDDFVLPPAIALLINEGCLNVNNSHELKKKLLNSGFIKELETQAKGSLFSDVYPNNHDKFTTNGFQVVPSATWNPLSFLNTCNDINCKIWFTNKFINSIGLYSDTAYITDEITAMLVSTDEYNDSFFKSLYCQLVAIKQLLPFVFDGLLRFLSPRNIFCDSCIDKYKKKIADVSNEIAYETRNSIKYRVYKIDGGHLLAIKSPMLDVGEHDDFVKLLFINDDQADLLTMSDQERKSGKISSKIIDMLMKYLSSSIQSDINRILHDARLSQQMSSTLFSNSRLEMIFLKKLEGQMPYIDDAENWERIRRINLPGIANLTADEILMVRDEAQNALPIFRKMLTNKLNLTGKDDQKTVNSIAEELNNQLVEVKVELNSINNPRKNRYRLEVASLAFSIVLYGLFTGNTATGLATLLASLAALGLDEIQDEQKFKKISSAPAFVLLKADEIKSNKSKP